ncbi:MAG: ammonium transporter [Bryobacterales bacterium]|nr:ammonium transporter [Bryobacterales bacterium]
MSCAMFNPDRLAARHSPRTLDIPKACDIAVGVRVAAGPGIPALDLSLHGEEAYNLES